jgi:hypothetical protein
VARLRRGAAVLEDLAVQIAKVTGVREVRFRERIQSLWSGYGEIWRVDLAGPAGMGARFPETLIVKWVNPPVGGSDLSHRRKLRSYEVERSWYGRFAERCGEDCRVPRAVHLRAAEGRWLFVLEDLDAAGFVGRRSRLTDHEVESCLRWLAAFHATFLDAPPDGLWKVGTYWHLETRPDELAALKEVDLRRAAPLLDAQLSAARFLTLVHGDAKVENFCFSGDSVAAVDFQYVGGGVGVKDVAYFLSSCLTPRECERFAPRYLDRYFGSLRDFLGRMRPSVDAAAVEQEWRALYPAAWADFYRFLLGWAPGERRDPYGDGLLRRALQRLDGLQENPRTTRSP